MIKLVCDKKQLNFESLEWGGSHNQSSRQISFSLPANRYDKEFETVNIKLGELVSVYNGKKRLFLGVVTSREKSAVIGSESYTAADFMHYFLRSTGTYKFKNLSPEKITEKLCRELGVKVGSLAKTGINIPKLICEDECLYDIIVKAYKKARAKTGKTYMPVMDGGKVCVIEKGEDSGVVLDQAKDITDASYEDTTDNMVNLVRIYTEDKKQVGKAENAGHVKRFGTYQATYTKEEGVDASKEAEAMLVGVTRTASVEAVGNLDAVAGRSITIRDKAVGLDGEFYIAEDSHTFQGGVHTMSLSLAWKAFPKGTKKGRPKGRESALKRR